MILLFQFAHFASLITLLMVIITAVQQIICLNRALKCADSTLVVPLFFAGGWRVKFLGLV
jgi:magnesium transporter